MKHHVNFELFKSGLSPTSRTLRWYRFDVVQLAAAADARLERLMSIARYAHAMYAQTRKHIDVSSNYVKNLTLSNRSNKAFHHCAPSVRTDIRVARTRPDSYVA